MIIFGVIVENLKHTYWCKFLKFESAEGSQHFLKSTGWLLTGFTLQNKFLPLFCKSSFKHTILLFTQNYLFFFLFPKRIFVTIFCPYNNMFIITFHLNPSSAICESMRFHSLTFCTFRFLLNKTWICDSLRL